MALRLLAATGLAVLLAASPATSRPAEPNPATSRPAEPNGRFVHHVFFWLKDPSSAADRDRLVAGLRNLTAVKTIRRYQIGKAAATRREVVDHSYSVSWLVEFDDKATHDRYQVDPIHLKFVDEYSGLWQRVVVYDSEAID